MPTSRRAVTCASSPIHACVSARMTPMSMPPATPTKPPAAPPPSVNVSIRSTDATITDWPTCVPAWSPLTIAPSPIHAFVITVSTTTSIAPATPTVPPPPAIARPSTSSLEIASTTTPPTKPVPNVSAGSTPWMPPRSVPLALPSTTASAPIAALVVFVTVITPTEAPMPTVPAMPTPVATMTTLEWSLARTWTLLPACATDRSPIVADVVRVITITATAPPTPTAPPPARPAATETTESVAVARTSMLPFASTIASSPMAAVVSISTTRTSAPGATLTPPLIASAPAMPRCEKSFAAATRTDWPATSESLSSLIRAKAPIHAFVCAVRIVTAPPTFTATEPAAPPEMPIVATSSRFVAVTATPVNGAVAGVTTRMPVSSTWFGGGESFARTIEWSLPVPRPFRSTWAPIFCGAFSSSCASLIVLPDANQTT